MKNAQTLTRLDHCGRVLADSAIEAQWYFCLRSEVQIVIDSQAAEIERLREALERSADTFKDFGTFMRMTDRPVLVGICAIAEGDARAVLSGRASEPEQRIIGIDCTQPSDEQQCADCGEQGHSHCTPVKEIDSP